MLFVCPPPPLSSQYTTLKTATGAVDSARAADWLLDVAAGRYAALASARAAGGLPFLADPPRPWASLLPAMPSWLSDLISEGERLALS